jgi:hypothetical protein
MKVKSLSFNRSSGRDGAVKTAIKLKQHPTLCPLTRQNRPLFEVPFSPFCNADTAGPVDPRASLGVFGSAGSACHVSGPTTPSGVRLSPCWNDFTASRVFGPKLLSMSETSSTFVMTKIICSRRTSGPVEPIDKVGPLFMTSSSTPQNAACSHYGSSLVRSIAGGQISALPMNARR